eukprot:GHRQ01025034.1.p1 GENE.GHRQ01025034.1~~GHRQ01025034.1.p1  ORF type:complete len:156 (-),score=62.11 GHRQ01025034.1:140-607(-)
MDARANSMAVVCSDGLARIYDLAAVRRNAQQTSSSLQQVQQLQEAQLQQLPASAGVLTTSSSGPSSRADADKGQRGQVAVLSDVINVPAKAAGKAAKQRSKGASSGSSARAGSALPGQLRVASLDAAAVALNKRKLQDMLSAYGEFPARYRQLIW